MPSLWGRRRRPSTSARIGKLASERYYADSSALVKLVVRESESAALAGAIPVGAHVLTSALAVVEVSRAVRRTAAEGDVEPPLAEVLDGCTIVDVERDVLRIAAGLSPLELRSYDAVHLATALAVMPDAMIVYDRRLARAAMEAGLRVLAPGASV